MKAMLEAAVNWIRAGLPMKSLKIVIYRKNPSKSRNLYASEDVVAIFEDFKKRIEDTQKKREEVRAYPDGLLGQCV